jgi:hypothetical protein
MMIVFQHQAREDRKIRSEEERMKRNGCGEKNLESQGGWV